MMAEKFSRHHHTFDILNTDYPIIGVLMLMAFAASIVAGHLTKKYQFNPNSTYSPCWSIFQCFAQKGNYDQPSNVKQRILFIIWLVGGFVTAATIGGQLVSLLAKQTRKPIATIRELAEATHIKIYFDSIPVQATLKVSFRRWI